MRCPYCRAADDKVVDSRLTEEDAAIRRRRECLVCSRRFTTYERLEELPLLVVKRSGQKDPFDRAKVTAGIARAAVNRPVEPDTIEALAAEVEEELRGVGLEVGSDQVGLAVLERLRTLDPVSYLRFASVYKGFEDVSDFEREVGLLTKTTAPKRRRSSPRT
ncbi:MAG TPA: transcriptional regulator NrdR [Acidimicrobiia bacterium]|nr:transcriptional regulator NrdR [Acidimicrobiia bacterium]